MPPGWPHHQGVGLSWGRIFLPLLLLLLTAPSRGDREDEETTPILLSRATTLLRPSSYHVKINGMDGLDCISGWGEAVSGATATLHCRIGRQGSHTVSWIRQGDLEILSVGSLLVSTNPRLSVHFDPRVNDHVLTIRQVQEANNYKYQS